MDESYFKRLKERFGKRVENMDWSVKSSKSGLNQIICNIADELAPYAASRAQIDRNAFKKRLYNVSMVEVPEVNGFTRSSDNWKTFEIGVNEGLMMFFHKMIKLFASRIGVMGTDGKPVEDPTIPWEESVCVARDLMSAFWENRLYSQLGFTVLHLSDNQLIMQGNLLHYTESFVVAHEFGHIIIKTSRGRITELDISKDAISKLLRDIKHLSRADQKSLEQNWSEEFAADLIGLQLLLSTENESMKKILVYSSTELVFILQDMLEDYYEKKYGRSLLSASHPSSRIRLALLRAIVGRDNPPQVLQIGQAFEQFAKMLIDQI